MLGDKLTAALRPDAQGFDEVRIITVPRYKTSGLSGDEWRISAEVQLMRKGNILYTRDCGDIESAAKFLSWFMVEAQEKGNGYFAGEQNYCDQEGCSETATVFLKKIKDWCSCCGGSKENSWKEFRKFCEKHKTRGDCGLDDCDSNYVRLESDPRA